MSGFQIFVVVVLTTLVVSGFWGAWMLRIRRDGKSSREEADALKEQLVSTRADMEHHRDAVFDAMAEGVMLCGLSGKVIFMNRTIRHLFEIPENVPDGITLLEALRLHEVHEVFERTVKNGRTMGVELNPSSLESRHLMLNAVVVHDASGKPEGVLLIFHDFTRLKELESARRDFVANVSHELRTPLSMIKGFVETVIDHPSMDKETLINFLGKVQKHSDRLALLIEDLLTISKLESGQATINLRELRLCLEISRVVGDLQRSAEKKNIDLTYSVAKDLFVKADADLLEQILLNLIDNAVKYGKTGGKVEVRALRNGADQICVSISDDGPGIPPEATDRIFERFFRVDKARSRAQGGTGLGLSIVKHIAQTLGGRVWVESEVGRGSTFFFTLNSSTAKGQSSQASADELSSAA